MVTHVILDVVSHCHRLGVAHRDLKPENFLLKRKALDPKQPLRAEDLRLVDFGLAISLTPKQVAHELLGSPFYIAPEILKASISDSNFAFLRHPNHPFLFTIRQVLTLVCI